MPPATSTSCAAAWPTRCCRGATKPARRSFSAAVHRAVGEALAAVVREQMAPVLAQHPVGLTLQVDEGPEVFDAKLGNLHPLFAKK